MCNLRIRKSFHCNPRDHVDNFINQYNLSKCISSAIFSFIYISRSWKNKKDWFFPRKTWSVHCGWINVLLMSNLSVAKFFWQNFGNSENIPRKLQAGTFKNFIQEWDILASLSLYFTYEMLKTKELWWMVVPSQN